MITQQRIDESSEQVRVAASQGYNQFRAAKSRHNDLLEQYRQQQIAESGLDPNGRAYVIGNTYKHRQTLKGMGLRWDAGHNAWVGTNAQLFGVDMPTGCRLVGQSEAALESMDHEHSIY